jgi:vacuolar-type H+-ATPase subunit I/STV1
MATNADNQDSTLSPTKWNIRTRRVVFLFGFLVLIIGIFGYLLQSSLQIEDYVELGMPIFWLILILIAAIIMTIGVIGKGKLFIIACIALLIIATIQIPITNKWANPPPEGPPIILSWDVQSGTRTPVLWVEMMDVNDDVLAVIVELRNQTSNTVYSNTSYAIASTESLAPHYSGNLSLTLNLSEMGVPMGNTGLVVKILLKDESGKYSSPREKIIQIPPAL